MIRTRIDSYQITELIGKGAMGVVYKARDVALERDVALKMIDPDHASDSGILKRFQREAKLLAKVQNPNIVNMYAFRETEYGFCIVMEYIEGETLASMLKKFGPLPLKRVLHIFQQILGALNDAHRAGVVHRDIKPGNIILKGNDLVKITDFGLARVTGEEQGTTVASIGGTTCYMSPEQLAGGVIDNRSDVWSVGVMMYETLSGHLPFEQHGQSIQPDTGLNSVPHSLKSYAPDVPNAIEHIVMRCLEKEKDSRFQNAAQIIGMFDQFQNNLTYQREAKTAVVNSSEESRTCTNAIPKTYFIYILSVCIFGVVSYLVVQVVNPKQPTIPNTKLSVSSIPEYCVVLINGQSIGTTPIINYEARAGIISLSVSKSGFIRKDTNVTMPATADVRFMFSLDSIRSIPIVAEIIPDTIKSVIMGALLLSSIPVSKVYVDEELKPTSGNNDARLFVTAGKHMVRFENTQYGPYGTFEAPVFIKEHETTPMRCYFEQYLNFGVRGESEWGTVVIDGKNLEQTAPIDHYPIGAGKHHINVTRKGYETVEGEQVIEITPSLDEKVIPLIFTLKKNESLDR